MNYSKLHILNGDMLARQLKGLLSEPYFTFNECLIEGPLECKDLDEFFQNRLKYLAEMYPEMDTFAYLDLVSDLQKLKQLPKEVTLYLWFEQDLFCQTNLWFLSFLLTRFEFKGDAYWVSASSTNPYSFGAIRPEELLWRLDHVSALNLSVMASLWEAYSSSNGNELLDRCNDLGELKPIIWPAVEAYVNSLPSNSNRGPMQIIGEILNKHQGASFGKVFVEFQKIAPVYGYGDLQLKRLYDLVIMDRT